MSQFGWALSKATSRYRDATIFTLHLFEEGGSQKEVIKII